LKIEGDNEIEEIVFGVTKLKIEEDEGDERILWKDLKEKNCRIGSYESIAKKKTIGNEGKEA
jgi:hypothetical protein